MDAIRFDPTIAAEYGLDRRPSGDSSGLFADLLGDQLKKRAETERCEPAPRRRPPVERRHAADSPNAQGRPIRPVIKHPTTIRGEAQEICDKPKIEARPEPKPEDSASATPEAESPEQADAEAGSQDQESAAAGTQAVAAIPVQQAPAEDTSTVTLDAATPQASAPAPEAPAAGETANASAEAAPGAEIVPDAASFAAALAASQAETIAAVVGGDTAAQATEALAATAADLVAPQPANAGPAKAPADAEPADPLALAPELTPPAPAQNVEPARPRQTRTEPGVEIKAQPTANPAQPQPQASVQAAAMQAQQAGAAETREAADGFDAGLDSQGPAIPGWSLHLAQGAANKRPDFIAQLRQHLQDLPAHEQVAVNIQRALREGTGRVSIQLSPAELGQIQVKLEIDEEKRVTAAVTVEKPSTLELLQRDIKGLERALQEAGLKMDGNDLSFSLGRQDGKEFAQDLGNSSRQGYGAGEAEVEVEPEIPAAQTAQVDTASGLVNLEI